MVLKVREIKVYDKKRREIIDNIITYRLRFIENTRFMPPHWLSNLVDNCAKKINKNKCKGCIDKHLKFIVENFKTKCRDCKTLY